uniref:Cold shock domain-containing protein E1-like n=1 Tax=Dermatophagoides pteronyssinus TaxID=6956 RepID=A0A6P6XZJ6_DERPT|nr:cold shock domain-containing protein E1-like [Dermatophagoides pteronyssinus]
MSNSSDSKIFLPNTDTFSTFYDSNNHFKHSSTSSPSSSSNQFNFSSSSTTSSSAMTIDHYQNSTSLLDSSCVKETGIIEKMLVSYGFIQCCERQARLFFHFSQYEDNIEHLKIGDPVEYELSFDRRTGKPVAIKIRKITSNNFMIKLNKSERLIGVIAAELSNDRVGRIAFDNMGEYFFLPFNIDDVVDDVNFKVNDKVSFVLSTDDNGSYRATSIQLERSSMPNNQGIISAIKDTFGFIERSECGMKIFFHSSDCEDFKSLIIGDIVQFDITTRKNKELAINVTKQINSDEEFSDKIYRGQVTKYNNRSNLTSGTIYCPELKKDYFFYDKDVRGNFTINCFDLVTFQIATDRRTHYERAVNVSFLVETFSTNSENRERGYVASLKDTYGFIKCPSKEGSLIYFKHAELLDPTIVLKLNDEVEFTFITDAQLKKCQAIRISILPNGTLFNSILSKQRQPNNNNNNHNNFQNNNNDNQQQQQSSQTTVNEVFNLIDLTTPMNITMNNHLINAENKDTQQQQQQQQNENGIIKQNGTTTITTNNNDDNNVYSSNWTKELMEIFQKNDNNNDSFMTITNGNLDYNHHTSLSNNESDEISGVRKTGIIILLKENYGFIESIDGENEYYFHSLSCNDDNCKLGQTVEFDTLFSNGKWKAINVSTKNELILYEDLSREIFIGTIVRTLQMFDNDQEEYIGLIDKIGIEGDNGIMNGWDKAEYEFSMISLKFLKDFINVGDSVRFQVATNPVTKKQRAYNVEVIRDRLKGTVLTLQRLYGFLKPDNPGIVGNIYFNAAEIRTNVKIKFGDKVDFLLVKNKKTDKFYAIDINRLDDHQLTSFGGSGGNGIGNNGSTTTTDRQFIRNFFINKETNGPKVIAIRQPKAPDGTKGFNDNSSSNIITFTTGQF